MLKPCTLLALTIPLAACGGDPPSPTQVRARIAADLGNVLHEGTAAGSSGVAALHADAALGLVGRFAGTSVIAKRTLRSGLLGKLLGATPDGNAESLDTSNDSATGDTSASINTDELVQQLDNTVFTDANYLGDGIYQVPSSLVCQTADPECVTQFSKLQLRLRVGEDGDALIIALQVDADHDEPIRFALTHTSLASTIDLDETGQAIAALAPILGEAAPNAKLAGELTGTIEILGPQSAKFSLSIDRKIDIQFADAGISLDSADAFRFATAAAKLAALTFDGVAGTGSLVVALGSTTAHVPSFDADVPGNAVDLDLPGASAVAMLATNQPLQLTHLALGDRTTTLSVGGQQAIAIDLNPDDGRALGATISHDAVSGKDTFSVSPKLDLRTSIDHAVLGDSQPTYDITWVLLTGSIRGGVDDQIEVLSGNFAITTNPAQFGFSAAPGQCVTPLEDQWSVGACN